MGRFTKKRWSEKRKPPLAPGELCPNCDYPTKAEVLGGQRTLTAYCDRCSTRFPQKAPGAGGAEG